MKLGSLSNLLSRIARRPREEPDDPPREVARAPVPTIARDPRLEEVLARLLLQRRWSFLRYVHLREGLLAATGTTSVLAIGAGRGLAELALALEFPAIRFRITDVASDQSPSYPWAQERARSWQLPNVEFGVLDVNEPITERFDLVASVEVVEHIEDDERAIRHMLDAARKYVYCLVPFADDATLADPRQQSRAWARHQHYRFGYSPERFRTLFSEIAAMRGCYFRDAGLRLRQTLDELDDESIRARALELETVAQADVSDRLPERPEQAQGIWVLARSGAATRGDWRAPAAGAQSVASGGLAATAAVRLQEVRRRLVFYRSWSYFRYLHLRQAFLETRDVATVLSVGSGRGLAELALALEFPEVAFQLSDIRSPHTSSSDAVMELAREWGLTNLGRTRHDILEPLPQAFDLVASVEVLEHIADDALAARHMQDASRRYTFCLVPYADARTAADPARRKRAWEKDHHFRFGYTPEDLRRLFPDPVVAMRGCYWQSGGGRLAAELRDLSDEALLEAAPRIIRDAECDLIDRVPQRYPQALGIWLLTQRPAGRNP